MEPMTALAISSGAASGASGLAGSIISSATARSNARYQAALQRTNAMWSALNMPSFQRQGLESAGYNPLLALGSGGASAGANSAIQVAGQDMSGLSDVGKGLGDIASAKLAEEERKKKEEQEEHAQDNADKLLDAQLKQIKATIGNINTHSAQRRLENEILQNKIDYPHPLSGVELNKTAKSTALWLDRKLHRIQHKVSNWWNSYSPFAS